MRPDGKDSRSADSTDSVVIPATVTVLAYNSAATISLCLDSVSSFDDVLVLDGGSTDETVPIALRHGARVLPQSTVPGPISDFTAVRERSFREAKHDWILWLDSDETVDEALVEAIRSIRSIAPSDDRIAYRADRIPIVNGRIIRYAYFLPDRVLRFVNRNTANWNRGKKVHEHLVVDDSVEVRNLPGAIYTPWATLAEYVKKDRYYLSLAFSKSLERRPTAFVTLRSVLKNLATAIAILCQAARMSLQYGRTGAVLPWAYHARFAKYHAAVARERVRQFISGCAYVPPSP